jgi:hypothetical protein
VGLGSGENRLGDLNFEDRKVKMYRVISQAIRKLQKNGTECNSKKERSLCIFAWLWVPVGEPSGVESSVSLEVANTKQTHQELYVNTAQISPP